MIPFLPAPSSGFPSNHGDTKSSGIIGTVDPSACGYLPNGAEVRFGWNSTGDQKVSRSKEDTTVDNPVEVSKEAIEVSVAKVGVETVAVSHTRAGSNSRSIFLAYFLDLSPCYATKRYYY
jgi:hypothetical protein